MSEDYTIGVEEEYQLVDPGTRGLSLRAAETVERVQEGALGERVVPEMRVSQVEALTPVCRTLSEVRAELVRLRGAVIAAAGEEGSLVAAASTHPFSDWRAHPVTPKERYERLIDRERRLGEEQVVFGSHFHVGLKDRGAGVEVLNRARVWLAPLLALSANSPYWLGEDTGYASFRTQVWGRLPTTGPPAPFSSLAEHDALLEALVAGGGAAEVSQVYWDVRLPEKVDTVEIRVADACARVDESVMLAGLSRALVHACRDRADRAEPYPRTRPELLRTAHFVASRDGLDADLVDVGAERAAPAREVIGDLLAFVRPSLEEFGDWEEVSSLVEETLKDGNGASRQRRAYERAGRLEDVVDTLVEETARGAE